MGAVVSRLWFAFNPPLAVKRSDALRFGILGAANIAYDSVLHVTNND